jgi:hypothetical protein
MFKACILAVALAASVDAACTGTNRGNTFAFSAATVNWGKVCLSPTSKCPLRFVLRLTLFLLPLLFPPSLSFSCPPKQGTANELCAQVILANAGSNSWVGFGKGTSMVGRCGPRSA